METNPDLRDLRKDFPLLQHELQGKPLVYLDTAATAQKPRFVIDTMRDFMENSYGTVNRAVYSLAARATDSYQQARETVRRFINAKQSNEIIFTRGTTESINFVAYSFGKAFVQPGDEILLSETEHHANIVPWQIMCEDRGATIRVIPVNDRAEIDLQAYAKLLSPKVKLVAVGHMSNAFGTIHPVKEMVKMAHDAGAKVLVDGAQATPQIPVDVQDLDADFYAFSGHKTYGPTGVGVLYGKEELLNALPPAQGGGDMIEEVTFEKTTYNVLPSKFEAGTPMIIEAVGLAAALEYLLAVGMDAIAAWEHKLMRHCTKLLEDIDGLRILGTAENKGGIVSFVVDDIHHLDIGTLLDLRGVAVRTGHHCTQPAMQRFGVTGTTRVSFGLYNNRDDVDQFVEHLQAVLKILRG